jgi:hypothetical protein
MEVIALRQLRGSYGLAATGDKIKVSDEVGKDLLKRKLVCMPADYQKKVVKPSATKQRGGSRPKPQASDQAPAGDDGDDDK